MITYVDKTEQNDSYLTLSKDLTTYLMKQNFTKLPVSVNFQNLKPKDFICQSHEQKAKQNKTNQDINDKEDMHNFVFGTFPIVILKSNFLHTMTIFVPFLGLLLEVLLFYFSYIYMWTKWNLALFQYKLEKIPCQWKERTA